MTGSVETENVETAPEVRSQRPKRADARRNYDKLISAARQAFTDDGASASLEDIARRAQVGIGTLYRHFPSRQALLEAVYVDEVEALSRSAAEFARLEPWDALTGWLHRLVGYIATKQALSEELFAYIDRDADVFRACRGELYGAGEPLLQRAQQAGVVRPDTNIVDVVHLVSGMTKIHAADPQQMERVLDMALDGLRYRPADR